MGWSGEDTMEHDLGGADDAEKVDEVPERLEQV